ncbi:MULTISPECIES: MerR family transcriptional regulator [Clostridium]|uniref:HTH-type transcriptional activator mta n=3 Tax=Clostridium TaxID=1485 RepID=D8GMU7_CLOLD|nr:MULTISPECIES: MerR family transcriptional regulator [Clostridium]ADK15735.1 transcriptional regulator [Clostridium ljungdahlii DSM 13528]AGY74987.1 MerR family transcriptional regulator [Clostridium autoethanogenum DSM 10061]ALU35161.1 putative transcriptional regulator MerR family [Clostridium autoethanogenum DSM 10061]OAA86622.1 HTH-type transcriptional activator mta [Clostridium ljungdahlii DSM 13528]OVY49338.1 HTH-type transcriptional activator mta [Clostridium autoethanogenum]
MTSHKSELVSIGKFAQKSGVTLRTLRYYDKIGLLKPCAYTESGHRLYNVEDFGKLQKILTLKFIGLSLEDISKIMNYDLNQGDLKRSLQIQKKIMKEKIYHIEAVIKSIDEAVHMLDNDKELNWNKFINIISIVNTDQKWMEQYENASNLKARIRIHELFSTNKRGWMKWFFNQLNIPSKASILELGCGNGELWQKNLDKIPEGWDITLTDFSPGMLQDTKNNLGINSKRFTFKIADVQNIPYEDNSFDVVIANHVLYHVSDVDKSLSEIYRVLKPKGYFYASTVGKNHMKEMREIVKKYNFKNITTDSFNITESFQLENGLLKLSKWFKDVKMKRYSDNLKLTAASPLIDYIFSMPGNTKTTFDKDKLESFAEYLQSEINKNGYIYITKDTGFFESRK